MCAMTSSGVHHARKRNAADDEKDQHIGKELRGTGHWGPVQHVVLFW